TGVQTCALPIFELLAQPPQLSGALLELAFELAAQVDHAGGCLAQLGVLYLPYIFRKCARPRADLVCETPDQTARSRGLSVLLRLPRRQATWAASSRAVDRPDHSHRLLLLRLRQPSDGHGDRGVIGRRGTLAVGTRRD